VEELERGRNLTKICKLNPMIKAIFPAGSKEGVVLESNEGKFKAGDAVFITLPEQSPELRPEQPVVKHLTTNYKVKNFASKVLEDGSLEASWELRDVFTFE